MSATARTAILGLLLASLALPPLLGANAYYLQVLNLAWISAIAALGLNIATGITGQIVLGQAALMGFGAYITALAMIHLHLPWWLALPIAIGSTGVAGVGLGRISVRIQGHYLAITTLALNEIFRLVVLNEDWLTGGPMGLRDIPTVSVPVLAGGPARELYWPLLATAIAVYALSLRVFRTRLGRDMRAVRDDELAAGSMGVNSPAVKTVAFVVCGIWAALAGGLYALSVGFLSPNNFTIFESIKLLLMVVIGGLGSIGGTFLGALVVTVLPELLRDLQTYYMAAFGLGVVVILLMEPRGLGIIADWLLAPWLPGYAKTGLKPAAAPAIAAPRDGSSGPVPRSAGGPVSLSASAPAELLPTEAEARPQGTAPILSVRDATKHFGGVAALEGVSLSVGAGEILGVIGPNGSGKSTLINACSGIVPLDAGRVELAGTDLTRLPAWEIHALGVSRIFQNVRLWESMTVLENVMLPHPESRKRGALEAVLGGPKLTVSEEAARQAALEALDLIGVSSLAERRASELSFGQSRLVEMARAIVNRPRVLLLDEPAAGLRGGLVMELAEILRRLRDQGMTVLVVEHRVKLVMSMCDRLVVLNLGEKIAEGVPSDVARDPLVIEAYLGGRIERETTPSSTPSA